MDRRRFVEAPNILGKRVTTRVDGKDMVTRFETVDDVGDIDVQHITVRNRAV